MSARRKPLRSPLDFDPGYARLRVVEHLSGEQRLQIRRLERVLACDVGETIATLAGAALFMFGLDPVARDAFDVVSGAVFDGDDGDLINAVINEPAQLGEKWTAQQRRHEREQALKGRAA